MNYKAMIITGACVLLAFITRADLPATITTTDGETYHGVSLIRTEADGYLVNYEPVKNGMGTAKIKFARLPDEMQKQAGYNPDKAGEFETGVAKANDALAQQSLNWDAAARAERQARQVREDQMEMQRAAFMAGTDQSAGTQAQTAGGAWNWTSWTDGYGLYAVPRLNRRVKTGFQPTPGHAPFARPMAAHPVHR